MKLTKICTSETETHSPQLNLQKPQNNLCIKDFNPHITNEHSLNLLLANKGKGISCGKENGGEGEIPVIIGKQREGEGDKLT